MKKKFICTVCGYIHEGTEAPAECPVCHAKAEKFKEFNPAALKGTKTEQNLKNAFAGESQAMSRLQVSSRRQHATRRSTLRSGSSSSMRVISLQLLRTSLTQLLVRTTSGLICTSRWQRTLSKRASQSWLLSSAALVRLRSTTRSVIASSWRISRTAWYSLAMATAFGSAATVVTSLSVRRLQPFALYVTTHRVSSRLRSQTIKSTQ